MKQKHQLFVLLFIVVHAARVSGQLNAEQLWTAVEHNECQSIAADLEKTPLTSEGMKFHAGICYYRNGNPERAMILFREVRQMESQKQHWATFWMAKCHTVFGQDSAALALLRAIPPEVLSYNMLSQQEFNRLSQNSPEFIQMKAALAPGFNIWTGSLAGIAGLGLFIGFVLLIGKSRFSAGEKRLSIVVFSFSLMLLAFVLIWTNYAMFYPLLTIVWPFFVFLVGPSLYLYLKETFREEFTFRGAAIHYIVPAAVAVFLLPRVLSLYGVKSSLESDLFVMSTSSTLFIGHLVFYSALIFSLTKNEWQVDTNIMVWTRIVAWGIILFTLAFLTYYILVNCSFFNPKWDYAISFVMAMGILTIAYMGLLQKRVFSSEPIAKFLPVQKYKTSGLTESASASIKKKLERLLQEERVYQENELHLDDLAAYLDISRHQLSQVINEHYGVNFFDFINKYRVEHVMRLLADPSYKQSTLMQIAYEAGFNTKVTFNRCFKKETGLTPSAYRIREQVEHH